MSAPNSTTGQACVPVGAVGYQRARGLTGLTRAQFAARDQLSTGVVAQVERGERPACLSLTAATAHALGLDVEMLHGQPYGPALTDLSAERAGVPTLRAALDPLGGRASVSSTGYLHLAKGIGKGMASLHTLERRIAALEARLADVEGEGGYGETLYSLRRSAVRNDLRMVRVLSHLGVTDVTEDDIDHVFDDEDNR